MGGRGHTRVSGLRVLSVTLTFSENYWKVSNFMKTYIFVSFYIRHYLRLVSSSQLYPVCHSNAPRLLRTVNKLSYLKLKTLTNNKTTLYKGRLCRGRRYAAWLWLCSDHSQTKQAYLGMHHCTFPMALCVLVTQHLKVNISKHVIYLLNLDAPCRQCLFLSCTDTAVNHLTNIYNKTKRPPLWPYQTFGDK